VRNLVPYPEGQYRLSKTRFYRNRILSQKSILKKKKKRERKKKMKRKNEQKTERSDE
jgi:hypothetical protein